LLAAAVAEVIASAFGSGMSWAGAIEGRPVYYPPLACASFRHALWAALAVTRTSLGHCHVWTCAR
jgi:hypothetical protein